MQWSQKREIFYQFVCAFSKFKFNFQHFQRKDDPQSCCIFELKESKRRG